MFDPIALSGLILYIWGVWRVRLGVRTLVSHAGNGGSNPPRATSKPSIIMCLAFLFGVPQLCQSGRGHIVVTFWSRQDQFQDSRQLGDPCDLEFPNQLR